MQDHKTTAFCKDHGAYSQEKMFNAGVLIFTSSCPACQEIKRKAKFAEEEERGRKKAASDRNRRLVKRLEECGLYDRFEKCSFTSFEVKTPKQKRAVDFSRDYAENFTPGVCAIFSGTTGTGKTHLASAIVRTVIERHDKAAVYVRASKIMREVKETYSRTSELSEEKIIKKYVSPDLLVIDEVGVQFGTPAEKNIMFEVLNDRYEQVKSTILISNLSIKGIEEFVGERVVDRMREGGGAILVFDWGSARK